MQYAHVWSTYVWLLTMVQQTATDRGGDYPPGGELKWKIFINASVKKVDEHENENLRLTNTII